MAAKMQFHDYNRAENAVRVGLALSLIAVLLNVLSLYVIDGNRAFDILGVALAVISMAAAYFADSFAIHSHCQKTQNFLISLCVLGCAASYCVWLLSFIV